MKPFFYLFCLSVLFSACTGGRIIAYFVPSTKDFHKVFPCDTIKNNHQNSRKLWDTLAQQSLPPIEQWIPRIQIEEYCKNDKTSLSEFLENTGTTSFLVMRNDSILYQNYPNEHQPSQAQVVFSVGKAITSTLVAIAIQEGKMSMDQSIADFIPEFCNDDRSRITVRHLLNMTSGIRWMDNTDLFRLSFLYYSHNLDRFVLHKTPLKYAPGTHFSYKSIGTQLLGMCLERATGKRLSEYLQEKIWTPLQMQDDAYFTMDSHKHRNNRAFGGLALSPRDMLRFGKLFIDEGKWQGKQIVPDWWVSELSNRTIETDKWWGYTNCWWLNGYLDENFLDGTDYFAAGFKDQLIYINPRHNTIIVRTGDKHGLSISWPVTFGRLTQLMNEGSNDFTDPGKDFSAQFEGVYETKRGERLEVVYHGKKDHKQRAWGLWKDVNGTLRTVKKYDLYQVDGRSLTYRNYGRQIRLVYEVVNGEVVGLYFSDLYSIDSKYFAKTRPLPAKRKKKSKKN